MVATIDDPLLTADEIVRLKKEGVADLNDVLVFATGQHREGQEVYSEADLDAIVRNFAALSAGDDPLLNVPVGIGHENTAAPAVGRITKVWKAKDGLRAQFSDLPRRFAEALDFEVWRYPSIVVDPEPPHGCPGSGCTLRSIDVVDQPAVKRLLKMPKPSWRGGKFSERLGSRVRCVKSAATSGRRRTFSEVVMDRAALTEQLKGMGWTDETIAALDNLPDEDFAMFVNSMLAQAAGVGAAPAGGEGSATANADAPPREQMIADLVAAGEDAAMLEAMTDADLLAKWTQQKGGSGDGSTANSEGTTVATPPVTQPAANAPAVESITPAQFAEFRRDYAEFKKTLATARVEQRQEQVARTRRTFAENERVVREVLKSATDRAAMTPATAELEFHDGMRAAQSAGRRKFGEKTLTDFEAWKQKIESLPSDRRRFAERIPAGGTGNAGMEAARRQQLLGATPIGRAILKTEAAAKKSA